jgi:hypothetical protein
MGFQTKMNRLFGEGTRQKQLFFYNLLQAFGRIVFWSIRHINAKPW